MELKNYMEDLVLMKIDEVLKDQKVCRCERCRMDIAAIALNNLPPKYYVTRRGEVYSRATSFNVQFEADVVAAILKAVKQVSGRPHHDRIDD
ncbi:hypothetical protein H0A61_01758 [Koleobacter methoxysyntrophicus]|uniref:Late competence development protein ComFB n=1 Tax=Koleobacter methoxysyntrophicus TaxID=2751313 RepID=A0A8A0RLW3_9FIRM|nr:late competence development ComFB family protein [Koleobacter methoxysyntrophicus]QSQ09395.1 hypothetical protein H0A61_01758 [Koleobacter methoxysyntrophicus]